MDGLTAPLLHPSRHPPLLLLLTSRSRCTSRNVSWWLVVSHLTWCHNCSKVMMRVGVAFTGGYALGTLIPTALAAVQSVEHETSTIPGTVVR